MPLDRTIDNPHRILTVKFEIAGADENTLLNIRARISAAAEETLPAALQDVFDDVAGPDRMLEINRLEVDLGELKPSEFDLASLAAATRKALAKLPMPNTDRTRRTVDSGVPDRPAEVTDSVTIVQTRRFADAALDAVIFYLRAGRLLASSVHTSLTPLFDAIEITPETASRLIAVLRVEPDPIRHAALIRLIAMAPPSMVIALIIAARKEIVGLLGGASGLEREIKAAQRSNEEIAALARQLLDASILDDDAVVAEDEKTSKQVHPATAETPEQESMLVAPNSGVVLLHPFLPRLFDICGLRDDKQFTSDLARVTAARLIHYLATGESQAEEPSLLIPRLLCDVRAEIPILSLEPLDQNLMEHADALLIAAIDHWTKLGNTSPDGLREAFLSRHGLLKGTPERPCIVVERSGVDVLIGALPWALSPIYLPWLPVPIQVDWT